MRCSHNVADTPRYCTLNATFDMFHIYSLCYNIMLCTTLATCAALLQHRYGCYCHTVHTCDPYAVSLTGPGRRTGTIPLQRKSRHSEGRPPKLHPHLPGGFVSLRAGRPHPHLPGGFVSLRAGRPQTLCPQGKKRSLTLTH